MDRYNDKTVENFVDSAAALFAATAGGVVMVIALFCSIVASQTFGVLSILVIMGVALVPAFFVTRTVFAILLPKFREESRTH